MSEGRTVLAPGDQISRRGNRQARHVAIPLCVREHVCAVVRLHDPWVLDPPGPLIRSLRIRVWVEHRGRAAREVQAVRALGEAEARGMAADLLLPACVLRAVQEKDPAIAHNRRGIERGVLLPRHDAVADGRAKTGRDTGSNNGVRLRRVYERTKPPRLLRWRPPGDGEHQAAADHSHRWAGGGESRLRDTNPAAATPSSTSHDTMGTRT